MNSLLNERQSFLPYHQRNSQFFRIHNCSCSHAQLLASKVTQLQFKLLSLFSRLAFAPVNKSIDINSERCNHLGRLSCSYLRSNSLLDALVSHNLLAALNRRPSVTRLEVPLITAPLIYFCKFPDAQQSHSRVKRLSLNMRQVRTFHRSEFCAKPFYRFRSRTRIIRRASRLPVRTATASMCSTA